MLTTGLLSLNIHEALSLEGTELCLHPDLFVTESSGGASQQTRSSHANKSAVSNDDNTTTSQQSSTPASSPDVLSVGDMIEIRVWDPLPKEAAIKSPATSLSSRKKPRQSSPAATPSTVTPPSVHVEGVQVELPFPNSTAVPAQASSLNLRPRAASMANSLAYSESEKGDLLPDNNSEINDASTTASSHDKDYTSMDQEVKSAASPTAASGNGTQQEATPPTKTVITTIENSNSSNPTNTTNAGSSALSSQLPPVFPRHQRRASTSDLIGSLPPKPPSQQSSQQTHCRGPSFSGALLGSLAVSSQQQVLRSPNPIGRHDRQMSDMTMESHQPDLREIQSMESHDDDVTTCDATWSKLSTTHKIRLSFVLLVTEKTLTTLRGNTRTQISMLRQVADLYSLSSYDTVTVHKIDPQDEEEVVNMVSADFLLVTIKDQFISRGDMLFFQKAMVGSWIYEGQRLNETTRGVKAHAREIRHGNRLAKSGIVTDKTMITFRSRSSRIIWLVQLSSEMWDYTSPYEHVDRPESICEVYFDQWIRFIYKLFTKWKELEVSAELKCVELIERRHEPQMENLCGTFRSLSHIFGLLLGHALFDGGFLQQNVFVEGTEVKFKLQRRVRTLIRGMGSVKSQALSICLLATHLTIICSPMLFPS